MEHDIAKVLSYEIKKELADRYFGFRKIIEDDKEDLLVALLSQLGDYFLHLHVSFPMFGGVFAPAASWRVRRNRAVTVGPGAS